MASSSEFTASPDGSINPLNFEDRILTLAELLKSQVDVTTFEKAILKHALDGFHARGGLIWKPVRQSDENSLVLQTQEGQLLPQTHFEGLETVRHAMIESGEHKVVYLSSLTSAEPVSPTTSESPGKVMLKPLVIDDQTVALLEIHQPSEPEMESGEAFLAMLAELYGECLKHQKLQQLEDENQQWHRFEEYACTLQKFWDPSDVYAHVIDAGRELCGFDRLTLLLGSGKQCRVRLVSTTDDPSRHSLTIQKLQDLSRLLTSADQELRYDGEVEQILAPLVQENLSQVLDATHARVFYAIPLRSVDTDQSTGQNAVTGMLVAENFRGDLEASAFSRFQRVAELSAPAIVRAAYWENLPGRWFLHAWLSLIRTPFQPKRTAWRWALFAVLFVVFLLVFVPAKFRVKSTGQLQAVDQHHVFAPVKAFVIDVHFQDDQPIVVDQRLLTLDDLDLKLKLEEVRGELERVGTRLTNIQTLRSQMIRNSSDSTEADELAAEANELSIKKVSLTAQWDILKTKESQLEILSPISGTLLTWNPQELLSSRPVDAGQILLTLADVEGDWQLEVKIPEEEMGHIRQALSENSDQLVIDYSPDAQVGQIFQATLVEDQIARRSEIDPDMLHYFRATVAVSVQDNYAPVSGAGVTVRIDCGSRALGYVLFHDLYEWTQKNLLF
ncbi:MAG: hypothetical protein P8M30_08035 [Planctomycetaceae bacterium]|jgi:multidrug efflux pump subunit AcrA (membrane-fusion protein)|nr:hypothetical protein [Planctomycetaceae bacterium]MDG2389255.1 hypothetical protein [Planctomycetaceae bacterium]